MTPADVRYYIDKFKKAAAKVDKTKLHQNNLDCWVGLRHDSVVLKIQNKAWLNPPEFATPFRESVFFSVWIGDEALSKHVLYYNIHALKMRELKTYKIKSREFAEAFRVKFKPFESEWPNVGVNFGPLTLMEGWIEFDKHTFESSIAALCNSFLNIAFIIDELLSERKK